MDAGFFDPAALFDAVDWAATPLGPRAGWARSLNAYLAQLMNSCRPLYLVWGPDRRFFYNEAFLPVMGVKHPAGFGQPMAEVWAEVWDEVGPLVASTIEEGKSHCFDDRPFVLRRHGHDELTYFSFAYTPVPDDDGDVSGLVCTLSERTKTIEEDEGRRSELHRLRALFQQAPGFVCVTQGEEHVIALVNRAYETLTGHADGALIGRPVAAAHPEVVEQGFIGLLDQVFETGEPFVGNALPVSLQRAPGVPPETRFVDFVHQPIRDDVGRITGIFTQGTDVTDRVCAEAGLRRTEAALREANARKDEFLAMLGHELRNPLAPICTAAEILAHGLSADDRLRHCVEIIQRQSRHMTSLVEDMVDLGRIENGIVVLNRVRLCANGILRNAIEQLRPKLVERRHRIEAVFAEEEPWVEADALRLTQVVSNLLANAIRYTPPEGLIRATVAVRPAVVRIEIADNGQGITAEQLPHLFTPFFQASRGAERSSTGLGLGLTLVKRLVDLHRGHVEAHSEGAGLGSVFAIEFPRMH